MKIRSALYHRNGLVRKCSAGLLAGVRFANRLVQSDDDLEISPPVLVNSFPKSGTHLLNQIATALPNRSEYGTFLASMTSSFRFKERTHENTLRSIRRIAAGEIVRSHLFHHAEYDQTLLEQNAVHFFIYRDLRDIVVSEAHYLRNINRWHRLHAHFRDLPTLADAITCSIEGLNKSKHGINYPNIAERFSRYAGWLESSRVCSIRFEDLVGPGRENSLARIAEFYCRRLDSSYCLETLVGNMREAIDPECSHTFREGKSGGWRKHFTPQHHRRFDEIAGDLLIRLGYETGHAWTKQKPSIASHGGPVSPRIEILNSQTLLQSNE